MSIGIFWYYNYQVIGIAHGFELTVQDSLGLVDSTYTHVEYWKTVQNTVSDLRDIQYEQIPRGRVIFNAKTNKTIVYLDSKLLKKTVANQICKFFNLKFDQVSWRKDPHYTTDNKKINRLFDN